MNGSGHFYCCAAFLARVNSFADVLIKLDAQCRRSAAFTPLQYPHPRPIRELKRRKRRAPGKLRRLSAANRTSHYSYLAGKRLLRVKLAGTLRKKKTVLFPLVQISQQLVALGLSRAQIWPTARLKYGTHDGRHNRTFWTRHTDHQLFDILQLARRGWLAKMLQAHPRLEGQDEEESKLLNVIYQNVERLFANHGIVLNG